MRRLPRSFQEEVDASMERTNKFIDSTNKAILAITIFVGAVIVAILGFGGWVTIQLLKHNGVI